MNIKDFETRPLASFRNGVCRTANFWFFHHLPKTAGTSMTRELNALLPPYYNIHQRPDLADRSWDQAVADDTRRFLDLHATAPFRSASGHLRPPEIGAIRARIPNTKTFTFLRHPVDQVVSQYRFCCTPKYPAYREHVARYPTFEHWLDDPAISANVICGFLAPPELVRAGDADKIIDRIKASYTFVGLVEEYELSFQFLTALMFAPVKPLRERFNATIETAANTLTLSDSLRERIAKINHLDMTIYAAFSTVFDRKRREIEQLVWDLSRG